MSKTWGNTHDQTAGNRLSVKIVGGLSVSRGGTLLTAQQLGGPKARQILEILLLQLGTPVSKGRLIDLLWGEGAPVAAVSTLESYISVLRRGLQPGMGKAGPLKTTSGGYYLDRELVDLDVNRFGALVREAERVAPVQAYPLLLEALALVDGPLLGNELLSEWAENERKFHADRVTAARLAAADVAARLGKTEEAIGWSQAVLAGDPLNEAAWTELIAALEQAGRPVEGLQAYERCRRVMDAELGCSPGPVLQEAQGRMLRATAGAEDEFGQVLSALLALHERVAGGNVPATVRGAEDNATFREAGSIVQRYLLRALTAA